MGSRIYCPKPRDPNKRALSEFLEDCPPSVSWQQREPASTRPSRKRQRVQPKVLATQRPQSAPPHAKQDSANQPYPTQLTVSAWLLSRYGSDRNDNANSIARPSSSPAYLDLDRQESPPKVLSILRTMSRPASYAEAGSSSQGTRFGTAHPAYRDTSFQNGVELDVSGRKLPETLREFSDEQISQQRTSPQLDDDAVGEVQDIAENLVDSPEGPISKSARSSMFPFQRQGVAEGGNSPWNTKALPRNAEYLYEIAAPKPDLHFGYPTGPRSGWTTAQANVANHPAARPYTQPARGNSFPFSTVELKSESAGGTLYVAENQAAGSGTHSVSALKWLLEQTSSTQTSSCTDTIAFSIALSHRHAIVHVHWYSEEERRYYMSFLQSYSCFTPNDIRACNNTVKNIIDHGLGARKTAIGAALKILFPFPANWKQARPPAPMTPSTSLSDGTNTAKRRMSRDD